MKKTDALKTDVLLARTPQVIEKLSDVLYKVNCGRAEKVQVIHCDRLRKAREQLLAGEELPADTVIRQNELENADEYTEQGDLEDISSGKRNRRKPAWLSDYVLSISSHPTMPKTKSTPRKWPVICPACRKPLGANENFRYHMLTCMGEAFGCDICAKTFKKKAYLTQHNRRKHSGIEAARSASPSHNFN